MAEEDPRSTMDDYLVQDLVGKGASCAVYKGIYLQTGETVALKMMKYDHCDSLEIKILNKLKPHPNVITLRDSISLGNKKGMCLVFEYMDDNLAARAPPLAAVVNRGNFAHDIKHYMKQLVTALVHCHDNNVLHRDIKCDNILVSQNKILKLADFGLSRTLDDYPDNSDDDANDAYVKSILRKLSPDRIALPHRPPELLLGSENYGPEVDVWATGSVFAQLLNGGTPIMRGTDKEDQLKRIYQVCGKNDEDAMNRSLRKEYGHFDPDALDLLEKMFVHDSAKRITARAALDEAYFSERS